MFTSGHSIARLVVEYLPPWESYFCINCYTLTKYPIANTKINSELMKQFASIGWIEGFKAIHSLAYGGQCAFDTAFIAAKFGHVGILRMMEYGIWLSKQKYKIMLQAARYNQISVMQFCREQTSWDF
jgi:hypothetical protein